MNDSCVDLASGVESSLLNFNCCYCIVVTFSFEVLGGDVTAQGPQDMVADRSVGRRPYLIFCCKNCKSSHLLCIAGSGQLSGKMINKIPSSG